MERSQEFHKVEQEYIVAQADAIRITSYNVCYTKLLRNTGAPFQSFNRSPQVTLTHEISKGFFGTVSAIHQSDYKSFSYNFV